MAQHTTISDILPAQWTQLTNADITSRFTFQVLAAQCWIKGTANANTPTDFLGANRYEAGRGEVNLTPLEFSPGMDFARLWVFPIHYIGEVQISHD